MPNQPNRLTQHQQQQQRQLWATYGNKKQASMANQYQQRATPTATTIANGGYQTTTTTTNNNNIPNASAAYNGRLRPPATVTVEQSLSKPHKRQQHLENQFMAIGNNQSTPNASNNAINTAAFQQAVNKAARRAAEQNQYQVGSSHNSMSKTYPQQQNAPSMERLRSAMSKRNPSTSNNQVQHQQQNYYHQQMPPSMMLKLQVSGEQLKPRMAAESRSQASLISSDPSGGTSKLSLPLMDRIKRFTSKIHNPLKSAFGSSNAVAPSSRNLSVDSLNQVVDRESPRPHHVRFVGVPPMDDEDQLQQQQFQQQRRPNSKLFTARAASNNVSPSTRPLQQSTQRYYRAVGPAQRSIASTTRPQDLQVTLV